MTETRKQWNFICQCEYYADKNPSNMKTKVKQIKIICHLILLQNLDYYSK